MNNKEFLLQMLQAETKLSSGGVLDLFQIINEYDWAVFCSQMGDYDHPGERVQAKKSWIKSCMNLPILLELKVMCWKML